MKFCTNCGTKLQDDDIFCPKCHPENCSQPSPTTSEKPVLQKLESHIKAKTWRIKAYMCPLIIGAILILVGFFIQVPGGALTTYDFLNGDKTEIYTFDDKYSSIDEYVGGDAYNFMIGASLVAGKISGTMTTKAIFIVGGASCLCLGITLKLLKNKEEQN